jgi:hypothetical protein
LLTHFFFVPALVTDLLFIICRRPFLTSVIHPDSTTAPTERNDNDNDNDNDIYQQHDQDTHQLFCPLHPASGPTAASLTISRL